MKPKFILLSVVLLCMHSMLYSQVKLNSFPSAKATIYLDFDGEYVVSAMWNYGTPIKCDAAGMSDAQITEAFNRVAEDYRPFNVNITTDEEVFLKAPADRRIRVIVTPTSSWFTGVGGIAFVGSFTWGDDTPCFVFCDRLGKKAKLVAECCAHESGHTLGLSHQAKYDATCNLTATYNDGTGTGEIAWAPIMGNSYYRNMSGWNNGPTPYGCSNVQDNLSIITSQNGFTYREDDYADDFATTAEINNPLAINIAGIISTNADKDVIKLNLPQNTAFRLQANPFSVADNNEGADLDIKLSLYKSDKTLIATYNPTNSMSVTIDTILMAGSYFLMVQGTGNNYAAEYGSLGSYTLTGVPGVLPICNATLAGEVIKSEHNLNWTLACEQIIQSVSLQQSTDGLNYTDKAAIDLRQRSISLEAHSSGEIYYRLKLITLGENILYSNIVALKQPDQFANQFTASTLVHDKLVVNAPTAFSYRLFDLNGNMVLKGNAAAGLSHIDVNSKPNGMYILQLFSNGMQQSKKITKQ